MLEKLSGNQCREEIGWKVDTDSRYWLHYRWLKFQQLEFEKKYLKKFRKIPDVETLIWAIGRDPHTKNISCDNVVI